MPAPATQALQLGAIAAITNIDIGELVATLPLVEPILAQELVLAIRGDGRELAVTAAITDRGAQPWLERLDTVLASEVRPFAKLLAFGDGYCELDLRSTVDQRGVSAALRTIGTQSPADERAALATLDIGDAVALSLSQHLDRLPTGQGVLGARVIANALEVEVGRVLPSTDHTRDAVLGILGELGVALGVSAPQRQLIANIHPLLARGQPVLLCFTVTKRHVVPRLTLRYAPMPWENALRFAEGLYRGDTARMLGKFAGAAGGADVSWLELDLGPDEPPLAWIATRQEPTKNLA